MSVRPRHSLIGRRLWPVGLAGAVLAAWAVPSGALADSPRALRAGSARVGHAAPKGTPSEVIDAKADPQAAAQALNAGCANLSNCSWNADSQITVDYGPSSILGDVLYNCADPKEEPEANAETAVGVSDERSETTSISEKVSLKISLGFLGFEKNSAEFEAFSKQAETFSTEVSTTNAVVVPPGDKGWTETQVLSASLTGSAYITHGINNLVQVENIDLDFPLSDAELKIIDPNDPRADVIYNGFSAPMTADDLATRCGAVNGLGAIKLTARPSRFKLTLCPPRGRCAIRNVAGTPPPRIRRATAVLTRGGRTYAAGTDTPGRIRLTERRKITAGKYRLIIKEKPKKMIVRTGPKRYQTAEQNMVTIVPVTIRRTPGHIKTGFVRDTP
jgi:hypothetical protein